MEVLVEKFRKKYNLSADDAYTLVSHMEKVCYKKKEIIVREGEKNNCLYIVKEGFWRAHYLKDGTEATIWFAAPGEIAYSIWGYTENLNSLISIEACNDSVAYSISRSKLNELFHTNLGLANLGRRLMEQNLLTIENWLISNSSPRAKERYLTLLHNTPEILQYVPQKHIASFLWITPQSLSRIRAGLKKREKRLGD